MHPLVVPPKRFASCRLTSADMVEVDGLMVHGAIDRSGLDPRLASGFVAEDAEFAAAEARAALLDVLSHPRVVPLNVPDPPTWFSMSTWRLWRERCQQAGVTTTRLVVGALTGSGLGEWSDAPYGSWLTNSGALARPPRREARAAFAASVVPALETTSTLCAGGSVLAGPGGITVSAAAAVLNRYGIRFASVTVDEQDQLVSVDSCPAVSWAVAECAAIEITAVMADDLARR
jgi:hypothetical protein